jgi:hypothetical protein
MTTPFPLKPDYDTPTTVLHTSYRQETYYLISWHLYELVVYISARLAVVGACL